MTDNDIVKAFECCYTDNADCEVCPLYDGEFCTNITQDKNYDFPIMILEVIKRLQAEVEDLKAENEKIHKAWREDLQDKIKFIHKQNEQLDELRLEKYGIKVVNKAVPTTKAVERYIRAKTVREFAERLSEKLRSNGVFPAIVKCAINDVVKEMRRISK